MDSGNVIVLVCEPCMKNQEADHGFKLAIRGVIGGYTPFGPAAATRNFENWLKKHRLCAGKGKPDHFVLAHALPRDSDQPKPRNGSLLNVVN